MDNTRKRNATRYMIQRARRLKQYLHTLYSVGHYQAVVTCSRKLANFKN